MSSKDGNRNSLKLSEAREATPPVNPVEAMRRQLSTALFGAVKEQDVLDMAGKLKEMAQAGNLGAMKMYFDLVLGSQKSAPPAPAAGDGTGLKMMAEALQDLVDEIRVGKARTERTAKERKLIANGVSAAGDHDEE